MSHRRREEASLLAMVVEAEGATLGLIQGHQVLGSCAVTPAPGTIAAGRILQPARMATAIRRAMRARGWKARRAVAAIGGHDVLVKTVSLPPMPVADRQAAVRSMVEPYVIFGGEEILVAVDPLAGPNLRQGLMISGAKRSHVTPVARALQSAGLEVVGLEARSLAVWRWVQQCWSIAGSGGTDQVSVAAVGDDGCLVLFFLTGRQIALIHRIDLESSGETEPAALAAGIGATVEVATRHLGERLQAEVSLRTIALLIPGAAEVAATLGSRLPAAELQILEHLTSEIGFEFETPLAAAALSGMAAAADDTSATPVLNLLPGEYQRDRALADELRTLVGSMAAIWAVLCLLSLGLAFATDREAARAEVSRRALREPMQTLRRLERVQEQVTAELEQLRTMIRVVNSLPGRRAQTFRQLATCIPPGVELSILRLRPDWIEVVGYAHGEDQVMILLRGLQVLESRGSIGRVELDRMSRDLEGEREPGDRAGLTSFIIRVEHASAGGAGPEVG